MWIPDQRTMKGDQRTGEKKPWRGRHARVWGGYPFSSKRQLAAHARQPQRAQRTKPFRARDRKRRKSQPGRLKLKGKFHWEASGYTNYSGGGVRDDSARGPIGGLTEKGYFQSKGCRPEGHRERGKGGKKYQKGLFGKEKEGEGNSDHCEKKKKTNTTSVRSKWNCKTREHSARKRVGRMREQGFQKSASWDQAFTVNKNLYNVSDDHSQKGGGKQVGLGKRLWGRNGICTRTILG